MSHGAEDQADENHVEFYFISSQIFTNFGLISGLIIHYKGEQFAFILGSTLVMISKLLIGLFFAPGPANNPYYLIFIVSFLGGQGACMLNLSCMQTLFK